MQLHEVEHFGTRSPLLAEGAPVRVAVLDATASPSPDARWVVQEGHLPRCQCGLWWSDTPPLRERRVGFIGNYAARDDQGARVLLDHACCELRKAGCSLAVGPVDGTTWGNYRFVTKSGNRPAFWREPSNPRRWPAQFVARGFRPLARYFSALGCDLQRHDRRLPGVARRLAAAGVRLRPLKASAFESDLDRIYTVAQTAFRQNLLYQDLPRQAYLALSRPLETLLPLELSWLAEHRDRVVGFLFAVPDFCEEAREGRVRTLVIKTLAVLPDRRYAGLGQVLIAEVQRHARGLGYDQVIHALVRDVPSLRNISVRTATPIRRYTLFAKELAP
jgi:GNAT superfamily N-acetyltransferase